MKVVIDLKSDSDNTFCDNYTVDIMSNNEAVKIVMSNPRREIVVKREDLLKAVSLIVE